QSGHGAGCGTGALPDHVSIHGRIPTHRRAADLKSESAPMEAFNNLMYGFSIALEPINMLYVFAGVFAGTIIGMLPGLGPISALALMIPLTFGMEPSSGLILMAGVYYGAIFGGSTSSILLNAPGVAGT